jgi:hypothetical protein
VLSLAPEVPPLGDAALEHCCVPVRDCAEAAPALRAGLPQCAAFIERARLAFEQGGCVAGVGRLGRLHVWG